MALAIFVASMARTTGIPGRRRGGARRCRRPRRGGHRPVRTRGGRLGRCRDHRAPDQVRQDRRHRRSRPVPRPGPSEGELPGVRARIRPGRFTEGHQRAPGQTLNLKAVAARTPALAAEYYPAGHWLSLMQVPDKSEFPGTGPDGNGISPNMKSQADWLRTLKSTRLHPVSSARQQGHARDSRVAGPIPERRGGLEPPHSVGTGGRADGRDPEPVRVGPGPEGVRRLDRSHPGRRTAAGAAAAAGRRTQRRHHAVGFCRPQGVPARRRLDRSAQSARQRERVGLRVARAERRLRAGARSGDERRQPDPVDGPRSEHAADLSRDAGAVAVLRQRADLDEQEQRAQPDARRQGPRCG